MALITDPEVIKFANEDTRPRSEDIVRLRTFLQDIKVRWDATISPILAGFADGDTIDDGREAQGASRLTKADMVNFQTQVNALLTSWDGGGVIQVLTKPNVRAL